MAEPLLVILVSSSSDEDDEDPTEEPVPWEPTSLQIIPGDEPNVPEHEDQEEAPADHPNMPDDDDNYEDPLGNEADDEWACEDDQDVSFEEEDEEDFLSMEEDEDDYEDEGNNDPNGGGFGEWQDKHHSGCQSMRKAALQYKQDFLMGYCAATDDFVHLRLEELIFNLNSLSSRLEGPTIHEKQEQAYLEATFTSLRDEFYGLIRNMQPYLLFYEEYKAGGFRGGQPWDERTRSEAEDADKASGVLTVAELQDSQATVVYPEVLDPRDRLSRKRPNPACGSRDNPGHLGCDPPKPPCGSRDNPGRHNRRRGSRDRSSSGRRPKGPDDDGQWI